MGHPSSDLKGMSDNGEKRVDTSQSVLFDIPVAS